MTKQEIKMGIIIAIFMVLALIVIAVMLESILGSDDFILVTLLLMVGLVIIWLFKARA